MIFMLLLTLLRALAVHIEQREDWSVCLRVCVCVCNVRDSESLCVCVCVYIHNPYVQTNIHNSHVHICRYVFSAHIHTNMNV